MKQVLFLSIILLSCLSSCSDDALKELVVAPPASIEHEVKGHEQIASVQAILRYARRREVAAEDINNIDRQTFSAYNLSHHKAPIPIYQEITFSKNGNGDMTIDSERKVFDVVKGKDVFYALELRYFDANNQLINHQFSGFYPKDKDINNSTLAVHQHFFTIQNYALKQPTPEGGIQTGYLLTYPMNLDSLYIDRYTFRHNATGQRIPSSISSAANIYCPQDAQANTIRYKYTLANKAIERAFTKEATSPYDLAGIRYLPFAAIDIEHLNELVPEIFSYEYRDTDPVEEELGAVMDGADDLGRVAERINVGNRVIRLRKERSLNPGADLDHLGFKGILQFHRSGITFQMRAAICHIITSEGNKGKYDHSVNPGGVRKHHQINKAWNNFDIDYPIPFRVIADMDASPNVYTAEVQRYYPTATSEELQRMLGDAKNYFARWEQTTM